MACASLASVITVAVYNHSSEKNQHAKHAKNAEHAKCQYTLG